MIGWKYFSHQELACPCCSEEKMDPVFMAKLVALRVELDFPFKISSAYRCEKHNKDVGGKPNSAHILGKAVDIVCSGQKAFKIVSKAESFGMTGIGVSQKGDHSKRFVHLDDLDTEIRPTIWSY